MVLRYLSRVFCPRAFNATLMHAVKGQEVLKLFHSSAPFVYYYSFSPIDTREEATREDTLVLTYNRTVFDILDVSVSRDNRYCSALRFPLAFLSCFFFLVQCCCLRLSCIVPNGLGSFDLVGTIDSMSEWLKLIGLPLTNNLYNRFSIFPMVTSKRPRRCWM